jgi:hypothetical protein
MEGTSQRIRASQKQEVAGAKAEALTRTGTGYYRGAPPRRLTQASGFALSVDSIAGWNRKFLASRYDTRGMTTQRGQQKRLEKNVLLQDMVRGFMNHNS